MVQIVPILGAISTVATTAWDTYAKIKGVRESVLAKKGDRQAHDALLARVEQLENACLEQARLLSDLSNDLDQYARALNSRYTTFKWALTSSLLMGATGLGLAVYLLLR